MNSELEAYRGGLLVGAVVGWLSTYVGPDALKAVSDELIGTEITEERARETVLRITKQHFNDLQLYGLARSLKAASVVSP